MSLTAKDYEELANIYMDNKELAKQMVMGLGRSFDPKNMYSLIAIKEGVNALKRFPIIRGRQAGKTKLLKQINRIKSIPLPHKLNLSNILNGSFSVKVLVCGEWLEYKI